VACDARCRVVLYTGPVVYTAEKEKKCGHRGQFASLVREHQRKYTHRHHQ